MAISPSAFASSPPPYTAKYDRAIQRAVKDFRPDFAWTRGKAQLIAESNLNATVCSSVGACGLAQFMPGTWSDVWHGGADAAPAQRFDAGLSIQAWAMETARLERFWRAPRPSEDRWSLVEASYNAGAGWILKAQQLCGNPPGYDAIVACLPRVTGDHARETLNYTPRIRVIWKRLENGT